MLLETGNYFAIARSNDGAESLRVGLTERKGRFGPLGLIPEARLRRAKAMKLLSMDEQAFSTSLPMSLIWHFGLSDPLFGACWKPLAFFAELLIFLPQPKILLQRHFRISIRFKIKDISAQR
jgi:hypothetical protein